MSSFGQTIERTKDFVWNGVLSSISAVFPIHPRTRKRFSEFNLLDELLSKPDLRLIDPISHLNMLVLEKKALLCPDRFERIAKGGFLFENPQSDLEKRNLVGLSVEKVQIIMK